MAKKNSVPTRIDSELHKMIIKVQGGYMIKGKKISTPRITLAMARQYMRNPRLQKELEEGITDP